MDRNKVELFWTSGWDSTYRLVELSREDVIVEPIYITEMGRESESIEIERHSIILNELRKKKETKATLLPVRYVRQSEIPQNIDISNAFNFIRNEVGLGVQYEILALYAAMNPGIEIGSEGGEPGTLRMTRALCEFGGMEIKGNEFTLHPDKATTEGRLVLGNMKYPIIDKPETVMRDNIVKWGYEDIMSHIWFCHNPINGRQCGLCRACEVKMETQMEFLLDEDAQKRYRIRERLRKLFGKRAALHICNKYFRK